MTLGKTWRAGFLSILALSACTAGGGSTPTVERVDSAGVEIVRSLGADRPLAWTFHPVRTIGGKDDGPEAFSSLWRGAVGVDGAGNVYVLDAGAHRVAVFGPDGRFLRTQGRQGGGPGELQMPFHMDVASDGTVHVLDVTKTSLVGWDPAGAVLPTSPGEARLTAAFALRGDTVLSVVPRASAPGSPAVDDLLVMGPRDTVRLASLQRAASGPVDFGCVGFSGLPPVFAPQVVWAARGERVAVAAGTEYVVDLHEAGGRGSIRRAVPPRPATREMALAEMPAEQVVHAGPQVCRIPAERWLDAAGQADMLPAVEELALAPGGELWVRRGDVKGEDAVQDVFSPDGEYLGTLPPGSPVPVAFTPAGELVAIEKDELDVPRLVFYRIDRGAPDA